MTQLITTQTKQRLLLLASGLLLLAFLSGSLNLSRAAGGRYRPGETPAGLTAGEWAQVRAHIEGAPPAASPLSQGEGVGVRAMVQQAYVKASNTNSGDQFYAVALSGDTLAVGASGEDSNAAGVNGNQADNSAGGAGAVYVFTRSGGVWSQQAYVKASNPERGDYFGSAVALAGDTLAVGAWREDSNAGGVNGNQGDNSAPEAGAVYVFTRSDGVWSQQAYVKASNTGADDNFGWSVALAGDTLAVGAVGEASSAVGVGGNQGDNAVPDSGAVYLFTRRGGVWSQQAYLKASNTGADDHFGSAVALAGDTLAVGASGEASSAVGVGSNQGDNSAPAAGAVYVFTRSGGVWSQQAYLKASNTGADDRFGSAVAMAGDTLAVGAPLEKSSAVGVNPPGGQEDNSASWAGAVYVLTRSGGVWSQQAYLKASNTEAYDSFGEEVALAGDTLAVGAYSEESSAVGVNPPGGEGDNSARDAGAAYVLTGFGPPGSTVYLPLVVK